MDRKAADLPAGVELIGQSIRIRFTWNKRRCCETLPLPQTAKGIAAAANLRAQVKGLDKPGALTPEKYAELFPKTRNAAVNYKVMPIFLDYAQDWLNSLQIVDGTRRNYRSALQVYWIPHLAPLPIDTITSVRLRKIVNEMEWTSPVRRKGVVGLLVALLNQAVADELIIRNPALSIPAAKVPKRPVDPFTKEEADLIIAKL